MPEIDRSATIGDIVAHNLRSAAVFTRHGIDFCGDGRQTLEDVCRTHALDTERVLQEVAEAGADAAPPCDMAVWPMERVIDHIMSTHHHYVRTQVPIIRAYTAKLARRHGERVPSLVRLQQAFGRLADDLLHHMEKEERVLFPFILLMLAARAEGRHLPSTPFGTIQNPVRMMELEHQRAGSELHEIRALTDQFTPPADACTTWRACYAALADFERDLHQHVHLEDQVLFPAATELERHG